MELCYVILAGNWGYDGEEDIKYCNDAPNIEDAQRIIQENKLYTYPICRVEVTGFKAA